MQKEEGTCRAEQWRERRGSAVGRRNVQGRRSCTLDGGDRWVYADGWLEWRWWAALYSGSGTGRETQRRRQRLPPACDSMPFVRLSTGVLIWQMQGGRRAAVTVGPPASSVRRSASLTTCERRSMMNGPQCELWPGVSRSHTRGPSYIDPFLSGSSDLVSGRSTAHRLSKRLEHCRQNEEMKFMALQSDTQWTATTLPTDGRHGKSTAV